MPCHDPIVNHDTDTDRPSGVYLELELVRTEKSMIEAVLCGVLRANPNVFESVDWNEVGVPPEFAKTWWQNHQEVDERKLLAKLKAKYE